MPHLSEAQRATLRARAAGLREEISSLTSEREQAQHGLSQDMEDARLLAEISALEAQREAAQEARDAATVTAEDATAIMEAAAAAQIEVVNDADPTGESSPTPAVDNTTDRPLKRDDVPPTAEQGGATEPAKGGSK